MNYCIEMNIFNFNYGTHNKSTYLTSLQNSVIYRNIFLLTEMFTHGFKLPKGGLCILIVEVS